jgi:hypothetical protein
VGSYPQSDWPIGLKRFGARFPPRDHGGTEGFRLRFFK